MRRRPPERNRRTTLFDPDAVGHTVLAKQLWAVRDDLRKIEQHAAGIRGRLQNRRQQPTVSAPDIDDRAECTEVVGRGQRRDRKLGHIGHGGVENPTQFRFVGQVFEYRFAAECWDHRIPVPDRVGEVAPVLAMLRRPDPPRHPGH